MTDGSSIAKWNQTFTFDIQGENEVLLEVGVGGGQDEFHLMYELQWLAMTCRCLYLAQVWNKNTFGDDLIGKARHPLGKAFASADESIWITLKRGRDNMDSGYVHLRIRFSPQVGPAICVFELRGNFHNPKHLTSLAL